MPEDLIARSAADSGRPASPPGSQHRGLGPNERWHAGNSGIPGGWVTSDVVWHGNSLGDVAGAENLADLLGSFIGALPDLYAAEQDITAENDLVMVRLIVTATVKGSLLGVPADGKPVRWNAIDIYRITDGKISEEWAADDIATIMTQVGVFTPPWAA